MSRFLESIKIQHKQISLLDFHQNRVNRTFQQYFPGQQPWLLSEILSKLPIPNERLYKLRMVYDAEDYQLELQAYRPKNIRSFQLVQDDQIYYSYKTEDRTHLTQLFQQRGAADDIIIVKNGLLTDSYYANLALLKEGQWFTPATPLLAGVKRDYLLQTGHLIAKEISVQELASYEKIVILNAMIDLEDQIGAPIRLIRLLS